jgi:hypothetical protein
VNDRTLVLWPQPARPHELHAERTRAERRATVQDTALVGPLQDRIDSRERRLTTRDEEIRRRDHIIAGQVEAMRALPAGDV